MALMKTMKIAEYKQVLATVRAYIARGISVEFKEWIIVMVLVKNRVFTIELC